MVYDHDTLNFPYESFPSFPSVSELHKENDTCPPKLLLKSEDYSLFPSPCPLTLYNSLTNSDYFFVIRYMPENTLKPCWFLV